MGNNYINIFNHYGVRDLLTSVIKRMGTFNAHHKCEDSNSCRDRVSLAQKAAMYKFMYGKINLEKKLLKSPIVHPIHILSSTKVTSTKNVHKSDTFSSFPHAPKIFASLRNR